MGNKRSPEGWGRMVVMGISAGVTLLLVRRLRNSSHLEDCSEDACSMRGAHWAAGHPSDAPVVPVPVAAGVARRSQPSAMAAVLLEAIALIASVIAAVALAQHVPGGALPATGLVAAAALCSFLLGASHASHTSMQATGGSVTPHATAAPPHSAHPPGSPALWIQPEMAGVWVKDHQLSDRMDAACDAMHLSGLVRVAVRLVRGIEIQIQLPSAGRPGHFEMAVFSVFPWFKVRERYDLDGAISRWNRRDLRKGTHQGYVQVLPSGKLHLHLKWAEPCGGTGTDEFMLMGPDQLHMVSQLHISGRADVTTFRTVYQRKH